MSDYLIDLTDYLPVNNLWSEFAVDLGLERAQHAARQALDLQRMQGHGKTLPVLISETCGLALINTDSLRSAFGISQFSDGLILILSTKNKSFQLLHEV